MHFLCLFSAVVSQIVASLPPSSNILLMGFAKLLKVRVNCFFIPVKLLAASTKTAQVLQITIMLLVTSQIFSFRQRLHHFQKLFTELCKNKIKS